VTEQGGAPRDRGGAPEGGAPRYPRVGTPGDTAQVLTITIGWGIVAAVAVAVATIWIMNHTTSEPAPVTPPTWPTVTRIHDGTPTVVQPEDLDRNTS
jgi:hypothetical protein